MKRAIRKLASIVLRNERLHSYLKSIYNDHKSEVANVSCIETDIPEAVAIVARTSPVSEIRINLLVPALSSEHVFGGISTALKFLHSIAHKQPNVRIILTEEYIFTKDSNPDYQGWRVVRMTDNDEEGHIITPAANRHGKTLPVGKNDFFIATAWWTAHLAENLTRQQQRLYGLNTPHKYIYLIQDFEPGFYSWSSRYALAESTYHQTDRYIAVFNTLLLMNYFESEGYRFSSSFYFEPVLHNELREYLNNSSEQKRDKKILVYGRPSVDRNAFEIIIMSLRLWVERSGQSDWSFYSAGEMHPDIPLGSGVTLKSLGKLSIKDYAKELLTSYGGISLMISPHPSYPPLEMAAFGLKVITNNYRSKDLSIISKNIRSVPTASPEMIFERLISITKEYFNDDFQCQNDCTGIDNFITAEDPFESIKLNLLSKLLNTAI